MSNKAAVPRPPAQTSPNRPPRPPQTQRPPVVQPPPLPRSTPSQPLHLPLPQRSVQQSLLADVGSPLDDEHGDPFETQGDNQVDPEKELAQIASQTETVIKDIESLERTFKDLVLTRRLSHLPHKIFPSAAPPTSTLDPSDDLTSLAREDFARVRAASAAAAEETRRQQMRDEEGVEKRRKIVDGFFEWRREVSRRLEGIVSGSFVALLGNVVGIERVAAEIVVVIGETCAEIWHIPCLNSAHSSSNPHFDSPSFLCLDHMPQEFPSESSRRPSKASNAAATSRPQARLLDILPWPQNIDPVTCAVRVGTTAYTPPASPDGSSSSTFQTPHATTASFTGPAGMSLAHPPAITVSPPSATPVPLASTQNQCRRPSIAGRRGSIATKPSAPNPPTQLKSSPVPRAPPVSLSAADTFAPGPPGARQYLVAQAPAPAPSQVQKQGRRRSLAPGVPSGPSSPPGGATNTGSPHDRLRLSYVVATQMGLACALDLVAQEVTGDAAGTGTASPTGELAWRCEVTTKKRVSAGPVLVGCAWWPGTGEAETDAGTSVSSKVSKGAASGTTGSGDATGIAAAQATSPGHVAPCVTLVVCHGDAAALVDLALPALTERWRISLADMRYIGRARRSKVIQIGANVPATVVSGASMDLMVPLPAMPTAKAPPLGVSKAVQGGGQPASRKDGANTAGGANSAWQLSMEGLAALCAVTALVTDGTRSGIVVGLDDGAVLRVGKRAKKKKDDGKGKTKGTGKDGEAKNDTKGPGEPKNVVKEKISSRDGSAQVGLETANEVNEARGHENVNDRTGSSGSVKAIISKEATSTEAEHAKSVDDVTVAERKVENAIVLEKEEEKEEVDISYLFSLADIPIYQDPNAVQSARGELREGRPDTVARRMAHAVSITPFIDAQHKPCLLVGCSDGTVRSHHVPPAPSPASAMAIHRVSPAREERRVWTGEAAGLDAPRGAEVSGEEMDGEVVAAAVLNGGGEGADVCVSVGEEGRLHIIHLSGVSPLVHSLRISCHERPKAPATVTNGKPATGGGKPGAPASSGVGTTWDPETNNAVTAVLRRHFSRKRVIGVEGDGRSVCAVFGREWTLLTLEKALAVVISREVAEKSARSLYG